MKAESQRAAVYLRVSVNDEGQTEDNQPRELRQFLEGEGYELVGEYVDHESGRTGRKERRVQSDVRGRRES